ncbi:MAG: sterol desaturase family protein [Bdellovibrionales bacterium]|nr:sterol desaturase family protein [Bdellovibrionales bacterium]
MTIQVSVIHNHLMSFLTDSESFYRLLFSLGGLLFFLGLGLLFPFRKTELIKNKRRWLDNLLLNFGNGFIVFLIAPLSLAQFAFMAEDQYWGLLNRVKWGELPSLFISLAVLDLVIYWQHRLTHKIPWLWRLHRVHHTDMEFDTTTAGRFHTFEIFFSFIVKAVVIFTLGVSAEAIILFEILLNFSALFNHTNITFPATVERILRATIVTPDMHRVHHSPLVDETNSNYGFCLSLWDRIFASYKEKSQQDLSTDNIGLKEFRDFSQLSYLKLLLNPFLKK